MPLENRMARDCVFVGLLGCFTPLFAQADFINDRQISLGLRNFYLDRDFHQTDAPKSRVGSWSQGFDFKAASGYTEGPVQFALDLYGQYAYRLDGGGGRGPDSVIPYDDSRGEPVQDYGRAAFAAKVRYSKTELKLGEHRPTLPVAYYDDTRQLVTTFNGVSIESKDIDKWTLTAGRFNQISSRESSDREKMYLFNGPDIKRRSDGLNFAGATYALTPQLAATYFYGQLEDIYQQQYFGLSHDLDLGGGYALKSDLRYFDNQEDGKALYGKIDNRSYGLMSALKKGGHTFGVAYQRMLGESGFPTLNGYAPQPYLVNWSVVSYVKPNESSWSVSYDYNFAAMGIPGLKFKTRYFRGTGIDRGNNALDQNVESERWLGLGYVVQDGTFKNLGLEWRRYDVKTRYGNGSAAGPDYTETRLITTYVVKF
ncbi:outer membrane porin, OprD family [Pseudomonas gessardii]|uniref:Outer membrane porin, OprD family n=2 Tax=Pseudomonas gessardii TaxID=78544 RepID=A0ABS9F8C3_9PSED|nr:outer membrane porin, OprD family [Pseudomonas gessardii]MCF4991141.1 outer membrane porin, OprD family [Pseudomonas gessardii]MCF5084079.1 outer membrane porin, OprD family [Pseudomonas gessardii]MCF5095687.1 outer membrane porin, OprD family [Pseudomonas gessardii]MCF5108599.1 outer membrane porin, OprD family [Pseudomonas gessardii]